MRFLLPALLLNVSVTSVIADDLIFQVGGTPVTESGSLLPEDALTVRFAERESGAVELTIDASGLPQNADKIHQVFVNFFQAGVSVADLELTELSGPSVKAFQQEADKAGPNHGGGKFDLGVQYRTSASNKFSSGEISRILIDHSSQKLWAASFNLGTEGSDSLRVKTHILDSGAGGESGFYVNHNTTAVPEPGQLGIMLIGLLGFCVVAGRRRRGEETNTIEP